VAIGLIGRAGAWIDQVGLVCAPIQADGTPAPNNPHTVGPVGGIGGSDFGQKLCPSGEVIVQIFVDGGGTSTAVDQITIGCQTPAAWKAQGPVDQNIPVNTNGPSASAGLYCSNGSLVSAVSVNTGMVSGHLSVTSFAISGCH
jgi:hypothetical protein